MAVVVNSPELRPLKVARRLVRGKGFDDFVDTELYKLMKSGDDSGSCETCGGLVQRYEDTLLASRFCALHTDIEIDKLAAVFAYGGRPSVMSNMVLLQALSELLGSVTDYLKATVVEGKVEKQT